MEYVFLIIGMILVSVAQYLVGTGYSFTSCTIAPGPGNHWVAVYNGRVFTSDDIGHTWVERATLKGEKWK